MKASLLSELESIVDYMKMVRPEQIPPQVMEDALQKRKELIPLLCKELEDILKNPKRKFIENEQFIVFSFLFFAQLKETAPAELILRFLNLPYFTSDDCFARFCTVSLDKVLANTCFERIDSIQSLSENTQLDCEARLAAISALFILYSRERVSREMLLHQMKKILKLPCDGKEIYWDQVIDYTIDLYPDEEALLLIKKRVEESLGDDSLSEYGTFKRVQENIKNLPPFEEWLDITKKVNTKDLTDCVEEMTEWYSSTHGDDTFIDGFIDEEDCGNYSHG